MYVDFWPAKKLQKYAKHHEAVIVLGCDSATETVRDSVKSNDCKVIEGMEAVGIMNAKLRLHLPCNVSFDDCKTIHISQEKKEKKGEVYHLKPRRSYVN